MISSFSTIWGFPSLSKGTAVTWDGPPRDLIDPRTGGRPRRLFPVAGVAVGRLPSSSSAPSTAGVAAFVGVNSAGFRGGRPRFRFMTGAGTGTGSGSASSPSSSASSSGPASPSEPSLSVGCLEVSMSVGPSRGVFVLLVSSPPPTPSAARGVGSGSKDGGSVIARVVC